HRGGGPRGRRHLRRRLGGVRRAGPGRRLPWSDRPAARRDRRMSDSFDVDAVLLDLDGTLLDTVADLAAATNAMLVEGGRAPLDLETVAAYVGKGAAVLVHRALGGGLDARVPADEFEPAMAAFMRHYERENGLRAVPYDGALEGLEAMRAKGLALACVTNKPQRFADALLERCAMARYFRLVVGGDALERRKPD